MYSDYALFFIRLVVGVIFIRHGWPKMKKPEGMAQGLKVSKFLIVLLGLVEILSGIAFIIGVYVQLASLLLAIIMLGAIYFKIVKWHIPFWAHDKTGWEFDLVLLAVAIFFHVYAAGM